MITVYFEKRGGSAEAVATFISEELYTACFPILQLIALETGYDYVTEAYEEEKDNHSCQSA